MKRFFPLLFLVFSFNVNAASLNTPASTKKLCQKAADSFGAGKPAESFKILGEHWPLPQQEITKLAYKTASQLKQVSSRFGDILGADFVGSEIVGNSFIRHSYIIKFERHAIRYLCTFYKPKSKWVVNSIAWDDKTSKFFK